MIQNILSLLSIDDFYVKSDNIDIAKGKNQIPKSFRQAIKQIKRAEAWKRKQ